MLVELSNLQNVTSEPGHVRCSLLFSVYAYGSDTASFFWIHLIAFACNTNCEQIVEQYHFCRAHVVQWSNHLGAMCSRAWRSQWPRIDSSLGPGASAY